MYNGISSVMANADDSPSFALMAISAYLKKQGYKVDLIFNKDSHKELKDKLKNCLCVGFSVYTGNGINHSLAVAEKIKKIDRKIPLVWGGYHPTLETRQTLENDFVDFVIRGQGELPFEQLLKYFLNHKSVRLTEINGLSYKKNGRIINNPPEVFIDINNFPPFDYGLYDFVYKSRDWVEYISSRGCPFNCDFCCSSAFSKTGGMRYSQFTTERILADLKEIVKKYHPRQIDFVDDNFLLNEKRLKDFIAGYKRNHFNFVWTAFCRCDFFAKLDEKIVKDLKEINLERVFFGVESGSFRILKMINKKIKLEDVLVSLRKAVKYGILADFSFINGFPNEEKNDVFKSIQLRNKIKSISPQSTVRFFTFTPFPGTKTMQQCLSLGYQKPRKLKDWVSYEYHSFTADWLSKSYQKFINNISWASFFDTITRENYFKNYSLFTRICFRLLKLDASLRFRFSFFDFALEFQAVGAIYRKRQLAG